MPSRIKQSHCNTFPGQLKTPQTHALLDELLYYLHTAHMCLVRSILNTTRGTCLRPYHINEIHGGVAFMHPLTRPFWPMTSLHDIDRDVRGTEHLQHKWWKTHINCHSLLIYRRNRQALRNLNWKNGCICLLILRVLPIVMHTTVSRWQSLHTWWSLCCTKRRVGTSLERSSAKMLSGNHSIQAEATAM